MDAASGVGAKTTTESMLQSRLALEGMALAVRGLSHSLYNALGPAMGNLNLLSGNIPDAKQSAIVDDVVLCLRQAERLPALSDQIMLFAFVMLFFGAVLQSVFAIINAVRAAILHRLAPA